MMASLVSTKKKRGSAIKKAMKGKKDENNEDIKMSPQQMNQWMYNQRTSRMQNNLKQNERWSNY
jgi:predicted amino acid-binding ACT domain protein